MLTEKRNMNGSPLNMAAQVLVSVLFLLPLSQSAKVLVVPNVSISHVRYCSQVGRALVERGHTVYALMNEDCKRSASTLEDAGIIIVPYHLLDRSCDTEDPKSDRYASQVFKPGDGKENELNFIQSNSLVYLREADPMFADETFDKLRALNLDLCIVDTFLLTLFNLIVPHKLGVPYISLVTGYFEMLAGIPGLPSFTPSILSTFTDKMTFTERIQNTIVTVSALRLITNLPTSNDDLISKYAPEKPDASMMDLLGRGKLWLLNTDVVLDYPRPTLPHVIHVGGLSTKPGKPLPESFQNTMDNGKKGIIILSFGSLVKNLPIEVMQKFMEAFRQLNDYDIIMRYVGPKITNVPRNTHLYTWLPQNDLLAHPSVKLFITHCGNNGQFEGLYHGVPMLGLPIYGDQAYNSNRMAAKNFGLGMSISNFTSEEFLGNIYEILNNNIYSKAVKKASSIYRSRPQVPTERAVYWIEHVLNYGGDYLLSHATQLPWYQFWLIDVMVFFFSIVFFGLVTTIFVIKVIYSFLCSARKSKLKSA